MRYKGSATFDSFLHDDVIKWKHFPRNWPCVWGIHRSPVISPHKGLWLRAFICSLICARINGWVNNREAGDLRRHRAHYDVTVIKSYISVWLLTCRCEERVNKNFIKHLKHTASVDHKRLKVKCLTCFCQREADGNRIRGYFQSLEHLAQALGTHNRWIDSSYLISRLIL